MVSKAVHPQSEPDYYGYSELADIEDELRGILVWSARFYPQCHNPYLGGIASVTAFEVVIRTLETIKGALPDLDPGSPKTFFNGK